MKTAVNDEGEEIENANLPERISVRDLVLCLDPILRRPIPMLHLTIPDADENENPNAIEEKRRLKKKTLFPKTSGPFLSPNSS